MGRMRVWALRYVSSSANGSSGAENQVIHLQHCCNRCRFFLDGRGGRRVADREHSRIE